MSCAFSIFTPTYNRARCLSKVYESLLKQDFSDFEWIIVNDGSTDNTKEVIQQFINDGLITICYIEQQNCGKHIAQNKALSVAKGELFLPLDSDDTIVSDALSTLWNTWIRLDDRTNYSGIGVLCMDSAGDVIGDLWPKDNMDSNDLDMVFIHHVQGEKWGPIRTDVMRNYLNDEVSGHYLSESTVWFRIAQKYKKRYINQPLRIYEISEDSISHKSSFAEDCNAESKLHANLIYINEFWNWFWHYDRRTGFILCLSSLKATLILDKPIILGRNSLAAKVSPPLPKLLVILLSPSARLYYSFRKALEIWSSRTA